MSTRSHASNRYTAKNYDRMTLVVKKGMRDLLREHADKSGVSVNRLINRLLHDHVPGFEMIDGVPVDQRKPDTTTGTEKKPFKSLLSGFISHWYIYT